MALGSQASPSSTSPPFPPFPSPTDFSGPATTTINANGGNPNNLLGANGPAPLIPAFLLSGLLVVGIVMMCWWRHIAQRRMNARYRAREEGEPGGTGMFLMAVGAEGDSADGMGIVMGRGGRRKKERRVGPKPGLWDVHLMLDDEGETERMKEVKWSDMKPVSANYTPTSTPRGIDSVQSSASFTAARTNRAIYIRGGPTNSSPADSRQPDPPSPIRSPTSQLRVSVLISMPTPPRPYSESEDAESDIEKLRSTGDYNLALGIAEVAVPNDTLR